MKMDNPSILDWNVTVSSIDRLLSLPSIVPTIIIPDDSCNEKNVTSIHLNQFSFLKELTIGSNSLNHVQTFELENLESLIRVFIRSNSLQDCLGLLMYSLPSLVTIEIGSNSFPTSSVFDINSELPALESLVIGSGCFGGNSSVIPNISSPPLQFNLHSLATLSELYLGSGSFPFFKQLNMSGRKQFQLCMEYDFLLTCRLYEFGKRLSGCAIPIK